MKRVYAAFVSVAMLCGAGCANEGPTGEELQEQFSRGVRGEGQLAPDIDRTDDPYVRPRGGPPAPRE